MPAVNKPAWWPGFATFYGFADTPDTTMDSGQMLNRLNLHLYPAPSQYSAHLKNTQGSAPSTAKLDFVVLTAAHDFIAAQGGSDYVAAGAGDDVIYGDAGNDILRGGMGNDLIVGGNEGDPATDRDTVSYIGAVAGVTMFLNNRTTYVATDGDGSYDMLIGIENVIGTDFADRIDGQDEVNNTIIGGLGADRLYGGGGNDHLLGGAGADRLYGETGADIINSGLGRDNIYLGVDTDADKIVIDAAILKDIANNRDNIYEFTTSDKIDVSALLREVGYTGPNPIADGYIKLGVINGDDLRIQFDPDGSGSAAVQHLVTLVDTPLASFTTANLITNAPTILYAAILGQSNAKGLSTGGADGVSGASRLRDGLLAMTDYDEVITLQRDGGTPIDIAVGGTTVDGNRNTSYKPDQIWWYPDQNRPGEVLLRAIDLMATQMADLRARGVVTPIVVWGQGEAETRLLGRGPNFEANVDRYIEATYDVFDYIKARLGDDIRFYIMETGRYNVDAARAAGETENEIALVQRGLDLLHTAQEDMALERDDIHLAANYSDLRMLHDTDPVTYPTDVWHMDYDDREIIGDRLAGFITADFGTNHVIQNPGPYPVRALADLTIHPAPSNGPGVINGTGGDDRLTGVAAGSEIHGLAGVDKIIATGGVNILEGGQGKDSITAASGRDTIVFGADLLPDVSLHSDFITKFQAGEGGDRIDISGLLAGIGYTGSDPIAYGYFKLVADGTRMKLYFDANGPGGSSPKYLATLADVDIASFSVEHNLLIQPEPAPPVISGLDIDGTLAPDLVIGTLGDDNIEALDGDDMIVAGAGADTLYGGAGSDSFIFDKSVWDEAFAPSSPPTGLEYADIIEDFIVGPGGDVLNIDILLELAGYGGANPVIDNYVRIENSGSDAVFSFDTDGGGAAPAVALALLKNVDAASFSFDDNLSPPSGSPPIA
ncbi:MAG: type I secretion C-terminal target domain-containing protein [Alphaproteobacteria bacterium PRO2]|nr:type I secretion C-terminal target domain-containing protein [Alphaproteobacteria bacterium PRO2]